MAIPSRTAKPGTYFITTATHNRRRLFQVESNATLLSKPSTTTVPVTSCTPTSSCPTTFTYSSPQPTSRSSEPCSSSREASPTASPQNSLSGNEASPTTASATPPTTTSAITTFTAIQSPPPLHDSRSTPLLLSQPKAPPRRVPQRLKPPPRLHAAARLKPCTKVAFSERL